VRIVDANKKKTKYVKERRKEMKIRGVWGVR